jgi:large subunit ribosomal protein L21
MYAVIKTGGKQYRVEKGQTLNVELVGDDDKVELTPILLVDGSTVISAPKELKSATVSAKVVGEAKGPKITGFTYKNKSNQRKRWGHRQHYSTIEITGISKGSKGSKGSEG